MDISHHLTLIYVELEIEMAGAVQVLCLLCVLFSVQWTDGAVGDVYYIGTGRYDITGPAVETEMVWRVLQFIKCLLKICVWGGGGGIKK